MCISGICEVVAVFMHMSVHADIAEVSSILVSEYSLVQEVHTYK